jgi:threonyl-tRNA synthetase
MLALRSLLLRRTRGRAAVAGLNGSPHRHGAGGRAAAFGSKAPAPSAHMLRRTELWEQEAARQAAQREAEDAAAAASGVAPRTFDVLLPNGNTVVGVAGRDTALSLWLAALREEAAATGREAGEAPPDVGTLTREMGVGARPLLGLDDAVVARWSSGRGGGEGGAQGSSSSSSSSSRGLVDLSQPLPPPGLGDDGAAGGGGGAGSLELLPFDCPEGQEVFWHSSAHLVGQALELHFGGGSGGSGGGEAAHVQLCDGPALSPGAGMGGFFYEMHLAQGDGGGGGDAAAAAAAAGGGEVQQQQQQQQQQQRGLSVSEDRDFAPLLKAAKWAMKKKQKFERMEVSRRTARSFFADNPFKLQMLSRIPTGEPVTLYRNGPFVDLCRGPHLPHTGRIKAVELTACSASHWESANARFGDDGDGGSAEGGAALAETEAAEAALVADAVEGKLLQRVYGVAFPSKELLQQWLARREEARKRDHRLVGVAQKLWFFSDLSPGSPFMLPHGARVFNRLLTMLRAEYAAWGYDEVMTPLLFKQELWATSGHLQNYAENMFGVAPGMDPASRAAAAAAEVAAGGGGGGGGDDGSSSAAAAGKEQSAFGLKPMNCPAHCLVFAAQRRSYRELPLRLADFSALHRNEATGTLTGLTRVRCFHQDDAHVFCRGIEEGTAEARADAAAQLGAEIDACIAFVQRVYGRFGLGTELRLSTRPEKSLGSEELWDQAEGALRDALDASGEAWELLPGDGAFYGPKIDVVVTDSLGRRHQCATIQLDFQLPIRCGGAAALHALALSARPASPLRAPPPPPPSPLLLANGSPAHSSPPCAALLPNPAVLLLPPPQVRPDLPGRGR